MDIWSALITAAAAFLGSWLAPFSKDKALANEEVRTHKRKLLSEAREAVQWFSGFEPTKSFINDSRYLAIRPYLPKELIVEIEAPFLPGAPLQLHGNREWGSPSLDTFRIAIGDLEKKWFRK